VLAYLEPNLANSSLERFCNPPVFKAYLKAQLSPEISLPSRSYPVLILFNKLWADSVVNGVPDKLN